MASKKENRRQWHSTTAKLRKADLDAIKLSLNAEDVLSSAKQTQGVKARSRRDLRKEKRQDHKAKQHASWMKKRGIEVKSKIEVSQVNKRSKKKKRRKRTNAEETKEAEAEKSNVDDLHAANEKEDKLIASLKKKLGMKKKKNLPSKFAEDGLDYLLEVCDPIENAGLYMPDSDNDDTINKSGEISDDEPEITTSKALKAHSERKKSKEVKRDDKHEKVCDHLEDDEDEDEEMVKSVESSIDVENNNDADRESEDPSKGSSCNEDEDDDCDEEVRSDAEDDENKKEGHNSLSSMGTVGKKRTGPTVSLPVEGKYVPPQLRKLMTNRTTEEDRKLDRLKKQLKGLVNRLSESNLASISQEIEKIYFSHSKNDTNSVLSQLLFDACIMPTHMPIKMLMEHMMLVGLLHATLGNEVGAFFIQSLVEKFSDLHSEESKYRGGKECDNVLMMTAQLYNFKVIDSLLMYDLIRELVKSFTERDIEMLMLLLKSIGPSLRRDDPGSLKEIILEIQSKAASCSDLVKQSRVRFMLDVISALRNNNLRKIPQYDPTLVENARKQIKAILKNRDSAGDMQLRVSLKDLLEAKNKGRWWVVGSAWAGRDVDNAKSGTANQITDSADSKLIKLAKLQRMNTEIRRTIFFIMISSEDYIDCFNKLLKLNLKDKQAREIVHVLIDCCLQEKIYNPYYAFLAQKLCEFSRGNQVTFQYSFWDRFKLISSSNAQSLTNLAKLIAHLFASNALSISLLKIVGFATIDKPSVRFFMELFTVLLTEYPESTMKHVFARIAPLPKLSLLREGLKIFLRHFLLSKNKKKEGKVDNSRLKDLVEIAEAALDGREVIKF